MDFWREGLYGMDPTWREARLAPDAEGDGDREQEQDSVKGEQEFLSSFCNKDRDEDGVYKQKDQGDEGGGDCKKRCEEQRDSPSE